AGGQQEDGQQGHSHGKVSGCRRVVNETPARPARHERMVTVTIVAGAGRSGQDPHRRAGGADRALPAAPSPWARTMSSPGAPARARGPMVQSSTRQNTAFR